LAALRAVHGRDARATFQTAQNLICAPQVFTIDFTDFRIYRCFKNQPVPVIEKPA
jgi:hypothetical protein